MNDDAISLIAKERQEHRKAGRYSEADAIRMKLLENDVVVFDHSIQLNSRGWMRIKQTQQTPAWDKCMSWSHRQLNFCDKPRAFGQWFCNHHINNGLRGRVPCPLDPRHHVKPAKVVSHLLVCESKPGCNNSGSTTETTTSTNISKALNDVATEITRKINDGMFMDNLKVVIDSALLSLKVLDPSTLKLLPLVKEYGIVHRDGTLGVRKKKEAPQHASIIRHLLAASSNNATNSSNRTDHVVAVECCAGRGGLSASLQHEVGILQPNAPTVDCYYMIDRCVRRKCVDERMRQFTGGAGSSSTSSSSGSGSSSVITTKVERLIMDMCMVRPSSLIEANHTTQLWMYGKHLCGSATDLTLKAAGCDILPSSSAISKEGNDLKIILCTAMCCHHLCEWNDLIGKNILLNDFNIDKDLFQIMKRLCTYYTKGSAKKKTKVTITEKGRLALLKNELGIKCKRLINECRMIAMKNSGQWSELKLIEYVDSKITPENQLLIGIRHVSAANNVYNMSDKNDSPSQEKPTSTKGHSPPPSKRRRRTLVVAVNEEPPIQTMQGVEDTYFPPKAPPKRPELDKDNYVVPPSDTPEITREMIDTGVNGIGVNIQVGMLVVRGPDWRYGRQDGGAIGGSSTINKNKKLKLGKVVELREWITTYNGTDGTTSGEPVTVPGSVRVQWLESKQVNVYRYGAENKWDVRVIDQVIHDVNWDSVMNEMSDDYRLPSQRKSLRDSIITSSEDIIVLEAMYSQMGGYQWRAKVGWVDRFGPQKETKENKNENENENENDTGKLSKGKRGGDMEGGDTEGVGEGEGEGEESLSDPCRDNWSGITCDTKSKPARIFAIDLSNNGLIGSIPSNIGNMTSLKTITLSNNRITGNLPETLGRCTLLEYLSLEINQIHGFIPRSYGRLSSLKWLSIYNNRFSGTVPKEVLRLPSLTHVFIQQNQFTGNRPIFSNILESYQYHQNQFTFSPNRDDL